MATKARRAHRGLAGALGIWLAGAVGSARAAEEIEANKSVLQLAVNETTASLALNDRGPSAACFYGLVLFDAATATGRLWYATLLEALSTGAAIDVIYDRSGNQCLLKQLHIR